MTEKDRKKTAGRPETVAPKPFVYGLFLFLARIIFKLLYRIRFVRDPRIAKTKGPIFIVGNHTSYPDPLYCALALPDRRIRFVSGQEVVDTKLLRPIVKHFSIIEIKPFRVNFSTTKEIITSIADGHSVALYPETQRSIAGGLTPFGLATAKLIKHLKVPVAAVVCRGSYLGWPRWGKGLQPGKIEVETHLLFTAQEATSMPVDDIQRRLVKTLNVDDYTWQTERKRPAHFLSRHRAEGLSYVCHWCPSCDQPLHMRSHRNRLFCSSCGQSFRIDATGFFRASPGSPAPFDHPLEFALWQRDRLVRALAEGDLLNSQCRLELFENIGNEPDPESVKRFGRLELSQDGLLFFDDKGSDPLRLELGQTPSLYCSPGEFVNLLEGELVWRAYPEEEGYVVLLTDYSRYIWSKDNHFDRYLYGD
ncbi:MAG: hypothetical protein GX850_04015 [Clostridiaceae bacterium]|nr:hypothetical protein [Clostridiaceae bacterium]